MENQTKGGEGVGAREANGATIWMVWVKRVVDEIKGGGGDGLLGKRVAISEQDGHK